MIYHIIRFLSNCLHFYLQVVLQRMWHFVPCKLYLFIFEEKDTKKITNRVILQIDFVCATVGHFQTLDYLNWILFVPPTVLQPEVLTHEYTKYNMLISFYFLYSFFQLVQRLLLVDIQQLLFLLVQGSGSLDALFGKLAIILLPFVIELSVVVRVGLWVVLPKLMLHIQIS